MPIHGLFPMVSGRKEELLERLAGVNKRLAAGERNQSLVYHACKILSDLEDLKEIERFKTLSHSERLVLLKSMFKKCDFDCIENGLYDFEVSLRCCG